MVIIFYLAGPPSPPTHHASFFTAEITAIPYALSQIFNIPPDNYIIYSDSLSALESMTPVYRFSYPLILNVLELHDCLTSKVFSILFCWIPSHDGISDSELADNLDKSATNSLNSPVLINDVKNYAKFILHSKWQTQWDRKDNKLHSIKRLMIVGLVYQSESSTQFSPD
ncbi:hypothetical protein AVEN_201224-1 [Araneus ventricosus]|uniref:Uncharacterized protein n=1 Tax=Araneus ventricosus TaxID=182803 RepID=A0A4Y2HPN9_ARAVE|nr:hypothetical protein AVEN_201224-1 [Araneus ventricosus]